MFVCIGMCGSFACVIALVHLTVLATAIRTISGLQFQKEKLKWGTVKEAERDVKPVKLKREASFMGIIFDYS